MKQKNLFVKIIFAVLLAVFLYVLIGDPAVAYNNYRLRKSITAVNAEAVELNQAVPFEWDSVYTFDPYTPKSEIEKTLGFHSPAIHEVINEGMMQLIFVKNRQVVSSVCGYSRLLGYRIDFQGRIDAKDHVLFRVERKNGIVTLIRDRL